MLSQEELDKILNKVRVYCSRAEKSEQDVKQYLNKYNLLSEEVEFIIDSLKLQSFINSERYLSAFIHDKIFINKWGKVKIFNALLQKGFSSTEINEQLNEIDLSAYLGQLEKIILLKKKSSAYIKSQDKRQYLINYCYSRGFAYEDVSKLI